MGVLFKNTIRQMNIHIASYLNCFMMCYHKVIIPSKGQGRSTELGGDPPPQLTIGYRVNVPYKRDTCWNGIFRFYFEVSIRMKKDIEH